MPTKKLKWVCPKCGGSIVCKRKEGSESKHVLTPDGSWHEVESWEDSDTEVYCENDREHGLQDYIYDKVNDIMF